MNHISEEILQAIDILIDRRIKELTFDRTVDGKIIEKTSAGYLVSTGGNQIKVSVVGEGGFHKGDIAKVHIPQNNLNNAYITVANRFSQPDKEG